MTLLVLGRMEEHDDTSEPHRDPTETETLLAPLPPAIIETLKTITNMSGAPKAKTNIHTVQHLHCYILIVYLRMNLGCGTYNSPCTVEPKR